MLELVLCSLLTVLPDYLYRHYAQGKRLGHEITLYSVWYELRWGLTACLLLTVTLITVIFYNHPSTTAATSFYRTVPIIPETNGRVAEVLVKLGDTVEQGTPLFKLDSSKQAAALEAAKKKVAEIDAAMVVGQSDLAAADGQIQQAKGALQQAIDELATKDELKKRNDGIVAGREIEKLQNAVETRKGGVAAAEAAKQAAVSKITTLLPAQKESALAALAQAQVDLDKTVIYAGISGHIEQFALQPGDFVGSFRPAGILIPQNSGRKSIQAGFSQIEAQVIKIGMAAEVTCVSKPLTIIPMVVTDVQDAISAGQFRGGEQLMDAQQVTRPGTLTVFLEPLYENGLQGVTPGSSCIANAYSSNHERLEKESLGLGTRLYLHLVDTVSVVHAIILRVQALLLPVQTLVLGGH